MSRFDVLVTSSASISAVVVCRGGPANCKQTDKLPVETGLTHVNCEKPQFYCEKSPGINPVHFILRIVYLEYLENSVPTYIGYSFLSRKHVTINYNE